MCHINNQQIAADGQVVNNVLLEIAAQPGIDPTIAKDLTDAGSSLVKVTASWTSGTPMAIFDDVMKAVTAALALIPVTAPYAWAAGIAQAAIDALWANFSTVTQPTPVTPSLLKAVSAKAESLSAVAPSPWHGKVEIKHHIAESYRGAIVRTWNDGVKEHPDTGFSALA